MTPYAFVGFSIALVLTLQGCRDGDETVEGGCYKDEATKCMTGKIAELAESAGKDQPDPNDVCNKLDEFRKCIKEKFCCGEEDLESQIQTQEATVASYKCNVKTCDAEGRRLRV